MENFFFIPLLISSLIINAQLNIKGKVVDEQNNPIPFVDIILKGTIFGTTTDNNGVFFLKTKKNRGTLEISFIGFKKQIIEVNKKTKFLNIVLKEGKNILEEVIFVAKPKKRLKKKENPAYKILKEIWKRKRKNGVDLVKFYQYKKHTTIEVGLNNLDKNFLKKIFKKDYNNIKKEIKYDSDGINFYLPVFFSEKISKIYGNNEIPKVRKDIEAEKEEGLNTKGFVFNRVSNAFRNINVFKNNIRLLNKTFVSPISSDGFATYDYVLYDSIVKKNKKFYNIYFFPIRNQDLAFKGNFLVSDKNYSIVELHMEVSKTANLNFVRGLTFEKEFKVKNDSIYIPVKNTYEGDFTLIDKNDSNKGLNIKKTITYSNYILNKALPNKFYYVNFEKIQPNQFLKKDNYWQKLKNPSKNKTYDLIKYVKNKKQIKRYTGLLNTLTTGYINLTNNIQLGPLWTTFAQNEVEGFRTKLSFRTFNTKDDRFRLSGNISYSFKDSRIKYGATAMYLLSYKPRITSSIAYQNDVDQLGGVVFKTSQIMERSFGSTALFSRGNNYFISNVQKIATNFEYAINKNLHIGFNFSRSYISSASPKNFSVSFLNSKGKLQSNFIDTYTDIYTIFTPGRIVYGLGVQQYFGRRFFPSIAINLRHGYKDIFKGTHNYDKIQIKYNQPIILGKFGLFDSTIEVGKIFGKVPVLLLSPLPSNQSYSLVKNTFSLMNYYDFVTDTYAMAHFEHHFNGFILNRIPFIKKLKLRSLLTFRTAYGTISKENRQINDGIVNSFGRKNIIYNTPNNKLYYEYGFGLENLGYGNIRFFRIDFIWRSPYKAAINSIAHPSPKFAIRIGIKPNL